MHGLPSDSVNGRFPKLFLSTKAYSGCRLMDLCGLKSGQLQGRPPGVPCRSHEGAQGKRRCRFPKTSLRHSPHSRAKPGRGKTTYRASRTALKAKGFPMHQLNPEFSPQRLYFWIETLFADYRKAHTDRPVLTTHMFRKRAFTIGMASGRRSSASIHRLWLQRGYADAALCRDGRAAGHG